jgi:outer membrane biosynthesis protein TonB
MDLAVYISELLGMQGEVSVPGIGHFAQVRINGYYNEAENKFYPPTHEVSFELQSRDNDSLAKYMANKKNISLASSKYFIEKYVTGIKQEVVSKKVEIAGLGYLYTNGSELAFTADYTSKANDPSFYGFPPVNIPQPDENAVINYAPPAEEEIVPVKEEAKVEEIPEKPIPTIIPHEPVSAEETQVEQEQEYQYDEPEESGRGNLWIALLLIVIIVLLAVLGLYKYKPSWFDRSEKQQTYVAVNPDTTNKDANTDTTASALKQDSAAKGASTIPPSTNQSAKVIDSTKVRFEVIGSSFKTQKTADLAIKNYKSIGIDAKVVPDAPGTRIQLSLGTYNTEQEAEKAKLDLIKTGKVTKDIYTLRINPKK